MKEPIEKVTRFFGSFGFACILLLCLAFLTWIGTLQQVEHGIYKVQKDYFDAYFVLHDFGFVVAPLPGVYLLLMLLSVNLVIGGIVRLRRRWDRSGILIGHLGICLLIAAGAVKFHNSEDGQLSMYPSESGGYFRSGTMWEIAMWRADADAQTALEHIVDGEDFTDLDVGEWRVFRDDAVPFEVVVESYHESCQVLPAGGRTSGRLVDGFYLDPLPWYREEDEIRNVAGCIAKVRSKSTGSEDMGILYGLAQFPWTANVDGELWQIELRPKTWDLPFTLVLDRFDRILHPGTGLAKEFSSYVTKIENGVEKKHHITMNEPLRTAGYTVYQSGWGPQDAREGQRLYSTFSIVRNPSDQWPLYSCIVIGIGLLLHFSLKLNSYIRSQARRREKA